MPFWRTFFDFSASPKWGHARIRVTVPLVVVPLQFLLLLLFHGNVFLQRDISSIAAHHSVRLDMLA